MYFVLFVLLGATDFSRCSSEHSCSRLCDRPKMLWSDLT